MDYGEKALREALTLLTATTPHRLADSDEAYFQSKENLYLKQARKNLKLVSKKWNLLLFRLRDEFQGDIYKIEDWSETATLDRCFVGRLAMRHAGQTMPSCIVFNVNFVAPLHIMYEAYNRKHDFLISSSLETFREQIGQIINTLFPEYIEMSAPSASVELDNIMFDNLGILEGWETDICRKMTLFSAFFSNSYY